MKRTNLAKKLTAVMMTGVMVASMGMTSFAEGSQEPKNVAITKQIDKDTNVYAPNATFNFEITPLTEQTGLKDADGQPLSSPASGASITNAIESVPKNTDIGNALITVGETSITIGNGFEYPGIYRYEVKEVTPEDDAKVDGVTYSTETKYFDIYVGSDLEPYAYTFVDKDDPKVKDDGIFINKYGKDGEGNDNLFDLTISKTVTGNQGDLSREFAFTIKVDGETGEQYYVVYGKDNTTITLTSGQEGTIYLASNETATIYGLDSDDKYTITEEDLKSEGYKTTIDEEETNTTSGTISTDKTINVENNKAVTTPTGIAMTFAPYALMVAFAGVFAVMFLRKKREDF